MCVCVCMCLYVCVCACVCVCVRVFVGMCWGMYLLQASAAGPANYSNNRAQPFSPNLSAHMPCACRCSTPKAPSISLGAPYLPVCALSRFVRPISLRAPYLPVCALPRFVRPILLCAPYLALCALSCFVRPISLCAPSIVQRLPET